MEKIYPEWNGLGARKLLSLWLSTTRKVLSSLQCTGMRDTRLMGKYRLASLRRRAVFRLSPSGNTEDERAYGDCCACSSSTKSKQPFSPVPWRWNKIHPSVTRLLPEAMMFAGMDCVGWNNGTLTVIPKRRAFAEPWPRSRKRQVVGPWAGSRNPGLASIRERFWPKKGFCMIV